MFSGFTDETVQFLLDLKFHNNAEYFHANHERYIQTVQTPFYEFIDDLAPEMLRIDPRMEVRPYKCLSRIHRDTRFSRDKSPYRDHHWLLFRRAAEPREQSVNYFFEFGPDRLNWGMGVWGENKELFDLFRKRMRSNPEGIMALLDDMSMGRKHLVLSGSTYKRMEIPPEIPERLKVWYSVREMYICKYDAEYRMAFSDRLIKEVRKDFRTMAPFYRLLRGYADEMKKDEKE